MSKLFAGVVAFALLTPTVPAFALDDAQQAAAGRALTGLLMDRCHEAVLDPAATPSERRYACNPTGPETCVATTDGDEACAVRSELPRACRLYLHPEWYANRADWFPIPAEVERFDREITAVYSNTYTQPERGGITLLASTTLPDISGEVTTAKTECGTREELRELRRCKQLERIWKERPDIVGPPSCVHPAKNAWKCTKRNRKTGKRKCRMTQPRATAEREAYAEKARQYCGKLLVRDNNDDGIPEYQLSWNAGGHGLVRATWNGSRLVPDTSVPRIAILATYGANLTINADLDIDRTKCSPPKRAMLRKSNTISGWSADDHDDAAGRYSTISTN